MSSSHGIGGNLSRIHRLQLKYLKPLFDSQGLPPSCFPFILNLHLHPGISQKQLCDITKVDEAIATRLLKNMETLGFVTKQRNPADHRAFQLYLTAQGESLYPKIHDALDLWWRYLLDGLPSDVLSQSLATMTERAAELANQKEEIK